MQLLLSNPWGYLASLAVGVTLGLLGAGGSILTVPILVYLFSVAPMQATGYSLFVVGLTAFIGMLGALRRGQVNFRMGALFAVPSFAGVYLARRLLVPAIPAEIARFGTFMLTRDALIMGVFGTIMIVASYLMIRPAAQAKAAHRDGAAKAILVALDGLAVGMLSGFVGAGGGFLIIPALVVLAGLPMKEAIGTSLLIIAANSALGFLGDLSVQHSIDWHFLFIFSGFSILGIMIGSYASRFVSGAKLKPAFGWFVMVLGSWVLFKNVS